MKNLIIYALCLSTTYLALGQEEKETITKDISFRNGGSNPVLQVDNINGSVQVEAYEGNTIRLEAQKTLKGKTADDLARARQEIKLGIAEAGDSILVYIDGPMLYQRGPTGWRRYSENNNWNKDYQYEFNFKIKVPARTHLFVSTVNQGDVRIENTQGTVQASNVNGPVLVTGIVGATKAHTVNGPVSVSYRQSPPADCSYKTINGDIEVTYPPTLSADLRFKSRHGEAFTAFDVAERLPSAIAKKSSSTQEQVYRFESTPGIRIGNGGPQHTFETLNGDITVKKIK